MKRSDMDDAGLDALFAAMRADAPEPSADLLARVLGDAEATVTATAPHGVAGAAPAGGLAGFVATLGGWRGIGGMLTAGMTGVWIGFADLASASGLTEGLAAVWTAAEGTEAVVDLYPGAADFEAALEVEDEG